jgi:hypothetical protein
MTQEVGKLRELNIKPGDVVKCAGSYSEPFTAGKHYTVTDNGWLIDDEGDEWFPNSRIFRVVSRATDSPKLLRDMTDAEVGALVRAKNEGKTIQSRYKDGVWRDFTCSPRWSAATAYRIEPEPTRETVTIAIDGNGDPSDVLQDDDEARILYDRVDGVIDRSTLRWEENQ